MEKQLEVIAKIYDRHIIEHEKRILLVMIICQITS